VKKNKQQYNNETTAFQLPKVFLRFLLTLGIILAKKKLSPTYHLTVTYSKGILTSKGHSLLNYLIDVHQKSN
jgi:hypothetical protein